MIKGNWEQVKDLSDILRIVSENIGDEFAQKVEEIVEEIKEEISDINEKIWNVRYSLLLSISVENIWSDNILFVTINRIF